MFSVVLDLFLSLDTEIWLIVLVLCTLESSFVKQRLSAITVQLELEYLDNRKSDIIMVTDF